MRSQLATPPYSTHSASGPSPMEPIIIPPPLTNLPAVQYQNSSASGFRHQVPRFDSVPYYQTTADLAVAAAGSPNIVALADLFGTLKHNLATLSTIFGGIGARIERLASLGPAMKAAEQIDDIRSKLQKQIQDQEASMHEVRLLLESVIHENLVKQLKRQIYDTIKDAISKEIKERVQRELLAQMPERLLQQVVHQEIPAIEIQTDDLSPASHPTIREESPVQGPLRPLLRPLPTPAQSPTCVVKRALKPTESTVASPVSAFLTVPAPTPVVTSATLTMIPHPKTFYLTPSTLSPLLRSEILSLFSIRSGGAKRLLRDYKTSEERSELFPNPDDHPKVYSEPGHGLKVIPRSEQTGKPLGNLNITDFRGHESSKFIFPLGQVPLLMVPAPKPRGPADIVSLSSGDELLMPPFTGGKGCVLYCSDARATERPRLHIVIPD